MTIAVFPGSFDPLTNGHLDLIERASHLFTQLVVVVGENTAKAGLFSTAEKVALIQASITHLPNVEVQVAAGLTVDFVHELGATVMVRGLRNTTDFEYEQGIAGMNRSLAADIETVFLLTAPQYAFISSSLIREVAKFNGNLGDLVPAPVAKALHERLGR